MKSDLSGEWVLDRAASQLTGGAAAMQTGVLRITHHDPTCAFHISMSAGGDPVVHAWESKIADDAPIGKGFYSRLSWDDDALVFACGSNGPEETWSMVWRYELLTPERLIAVEQMRGRGDFDNTWIFNKQ